MADTPETPIAATPDAGATSSSMSTTAADHDSASRAPTVDEPVAPLEPQEPLASASDASSTAASVQLPELGGSTAAKGGQHFSLLLDVGVEVAAVVGTRELKLEQVLAIQPGAIVDLDKHAGEPIELYVNGKPIALAEIVVVDGRLGARVVETLATPSSPKS